MYVPVSYSDDFEDVSRDETNLPEAIEKFYKTVTGIDEHHQLAYISFLLTILHLLEN
jgi:hypothetical protein